MRRFHVKRFLTLCASVLTLLVAENAKGEDEPLPPKVRKLIGMRTPAKAGDVVPGWTVQGAGLLGRKTEAGEELGYELLYQQNISVFLIDAKDTDLNRRIIDVRLLPRHLLNYEVRNGKIVIRRNSSRFYEFEHGCKSENFGPLVVGLVRPEPTKEDCGHWSMQVKRAWSIDPETGRITDIPAQGVACEIQAESICWN